MTTDISVVGGAYVEISAFPRSQVYRGSGVRAASVLAGLGSGVTLHTVLGDDLAGEYLQIAKLRGFEIHPIHAASTVYFHYQHPLSAAVVDQGPHSPVELGPGFQLGDALVFGMIEGRPIVHADRVVYDPQDGSRAQAFGTNGSKVRELAIVASYSEGKAITGHSDPEVIAQSLLAQPNCKIVVLKCGPQGALVATSISIGWIGAFPSNRVWKIGSGDVFSAAFAHAWLSDKMAPLDAAWFASRMVAEYVATRQEHFGSGVMASIRSDAQGARTRTLPAARVLPDKQIYLAAPFFTTAEQWAVDEARGALTELGFQVFSPIHDIGEGLPSEVAPADLHAIEHSGLVFALLDGADPGTLFEVGYARALNIPVVAVAEALDERALTMLTGSACTITDDFTTGIYMACWQLMKDD